ncbi:multidrug effflux MFS transporter [Nocardia alni]|uniref:multidrug effflux MFS transporter n=1 Tax=Nocardia alni TaxID=2815723 RepID=UPI001C211A78|nr:multidrug effflux MFS transporter [Nocardia alni]
MRKSADPGVAGLLLVVLGLLSAVAPFATDMYLPSFTGMAANLHTGASSVQLTLTTFLVGLAAGQLVIGPLSDRFGRRRPLLLATAIATVATVAIAIAPTIWVLIVLRFVQGFAGAAGIVIARAVAADRVGGVAAARIFTLFASITGIAPVIAPLLGGVLAKVGWRAEFWVLSGIFLVMFLGSLAIVPESLPPERRHGGGLAATGRTLWGLLRDRGYVGYILAFAFGFAALMSYISASPFVLQDVLGLTTTEYTVDFAVNAFGMVTLGLIVSRLVKRVRPQTILTIGQAVVLIFGAILLSLLAAHAPVWAVLPVLFVMVSSVTMIMGTASALAVGRARQSAGSASALLGALQFVLGALVSPMVGLGGSDTGIPMGMLIVVSAVLGLSARLLTRGADDAAGQPEHTAAAA